MPTTNTKPSRHALALPLLLLLLIVAGAAAQPNDWRDDRSDDDDDGRRMPPGPRARQPPPPSFSAPMVVLLVALIAVFFFIGFFSIYIRQCGRGGASSGPAIPAAALLALSRQEQQQQQNQLQQRNGLDPALVASFPTMTYAEARALRVRDDGKGKDDMAVLECAVCLSEFDDDEELRLLPKCSHAFHPDCIGEWLAGHVTCPVCRCSLKPEEHEEVEPAAAAEANVSSEQQQDQDQVAIDMNGQEEERRREEEEEATELDRIGSQRRAMRSRSGRSISRAHSTGHCHSLSLSARRPRELDLERFTLRLPEQVRREMEAESMRRAVARDARSARIGRSDRWQQQQSFIARTFSSSRVPFWGAAASRRAPPDAEAGAGGVLPAGSTTTMTPAATTTGQGRAVREKTGDGSVGSAKMGSVRFDCLGGGGAVAADDSENEAEEEKAIVPRV